MQWLRDGLGIIQDARETGPLAASVESADGVVFVPAFTGLGAPHWDPDARGSMFGLTRGTTRAHLARATLEAIAHQTADVLDAMQSDAGLTLDRLRIDGGAAANDVLLQLHADFLGVPVERPANVEATAWGVAAMAGSPLAYYAGGGRPGRARGDVRAEAECRTPPEAAGGVAAGGRAHAGVVAVASGRAG